MTSSIRTFFPWLAPAPAHSAWLGILAVAGAFGLFAAAQAFWPTFQAPAAEEPPVMEEPAASIAPARRRCETCGTVEAIDRTEAAEGRPAGWVFTVRLPDGSLRHSPDALRGRWQVGDGMQLIGGATAPANLP